MKSLQLASFYEPILGPVLKSLRKEVIKLANLSEQDIFLDCCCGAGGLLALQSNSAYALGVDISMKMLSEAPKNANYAKIICANAAYLPFADKSVDVSSVCLALHAMPQKIATLCVNELCRVSKRVIIADYCLTERNIYYPANFLAHAVEFMVGGEHYKCYKNFMRLGAVEGFLHQMGKEPQNRRMSLGGAALIVDLMV